MSETDLVSTPPARKRGGLTGMVLADLRQLAAELKISDTTGMRKGDLIAAIKERQTAGQDAGPSAGQGAPAAPAAAPQLSLPDAAAPAPSVATEPAAAPAPAPARRRRTASRPAGAPQSQSQPVTGTPAPAADAPAAAPAAAAPVVEAPAAATPVDAAPVAEAPAAPSATAPAAETAPVAEPATEQAAGERADAPAAAPAADAPAAQPDGGREERGGRRRQNRRSRGGEPAAEAAQSTPQAQNGQAPAAAAPQGTETDASGDDRGGRGRNRAQADRGDRAANGRAGTDRGPDRGANDRTDRGPDRTDDRGPNDREDPRGGDRNDRGDRAAAADPRGADRRPLNGDDDGDDDGDGRGRRGRRFRDRRRGRDRDGRDTRDPRGGGQVGGQGTVDTDVRDDDVLLPVAGIIDVLDNYAFVRTTGYLAGPTDCYVSLSQVRKYGLRRGDAITGAVREVREGEQTRQKFNPLVRVDSINGMDPDAARDRPDFTKLTPLYPNERLRLETEPSRLTTRVIDLVMPIGKGQRALIVSPPKAGKTTIMQNIANAITVNNPECHLMVVLVDERPEEVTDMQRSVKGEVIASTFDRPPSDHTTIAELSIERAKRLVELGHDVVVLLDNITRLGRAYNLAAPASGRILSGGVDSTALYPPKRFLGAARNIEDGGSLTILATALVETGSTMDTVIFEEFKGTGNAELKLDRRIADKRVFPAIDVGDSGTRKEELLMSPDEYGVMVKLRRLLSALDDQQAIDLLLTQLRKTRTNIEFLMQVAKGTPAGDND